MERRTIVRIDIDIDIDIGPANTDKRIKLDVPVVGDAKVVLGARSRFRRARTRTGTAD